MSGSGASAAVAARPGPLQAAPSRPSSCSSPSAFTPVPGAAKEAALGGGGGGDDDENGAVRGGDADEPGGTGPGGTGRGAEELVSGGRLAVEVAQAWVGSALLAFERSGGLMHEKHAGVGRGGGGGEYEPQVGFGWTNGCALVLLEKYGHCLASIDR